MVDGERGDAVQAIIGATERYGKRVTREAATIWNTAAQQRIMEAAGARADLDAQRDQRGPLEGRQEHQLHQLANAFSAPTWDSEEGAWVFACTHAFAGVHEWGAVPHEIEAKTAQALAFEWPDAPDEVKEQYEDTFPLVFFDSVEHPGVPAIGYMRHGRREAARNLQDAGFEVEEFARSLEGSDGDDGGDDG